MFRQHPQERELQYYRSRVQQLFEQQPKEDHPYIPNQQIQHGCTLKVESIASNNTEAFERFRKLVVIAVSTGAIILAIAGFMLFRCIQGASAQQPVQQHFQKNSKICGYQTTVSGTKVAMYYQTDTRQSLKSILNNSGPDSVETNCGY